MKSLINYINEGRKPLDVEQCVNDSVSGEEHGFDYVDLGLPSGTMWATCNLGANKPDNFGLLYQYGQTTGCKYDDRSFKFVEVSYESDNLKLYKDAVHTNMGGAWRMPTKADAEELADNTKGKVVRLNGIKGMLLTSNINGKSIFIPFCGIYQYSVERYHSIGSHTYIWCSDIVKGTESWRSEDAEKQPWALYCANSRYNTCLCQSLYMRDLSDAYSMRGVLKK